MKYLFIFIIVVANTSISSQTIIPSTFYPKSADQLSIDVISNLFGPITPHNYIEFYAGDSSYTSLQNAALITYQNNLIDTAIIYDSLGQIFKFLSIDVQVADSLSIQLYSNTGMLEGDIPVLKSFNNDSIQTVFKIGAPPFTSSKSCYYDTLGRLYNHTTYSLGVFHPRYVYYTGQNLQWDSIDVLYPGASTTYTETCYPYYLNGHVDSVNNGETSRIYTLRNAQGELLEIQEVQNNNVGKSIQKWKFLSVPLGMDDITKNDKVILFPNPASNIVSVTNLKNSTEFLIYDITGKSLLSGNYNGSINISELPSGVYYIRLNGDQTVIKKLVKK